MVKMEQPNVHKQLVAIITSTAFQLDWQRTEQKMSAEALVWQAELSKKWLAEPGVAFLGLGFERQQKHMTPSVAFVAQIAAAFVQALAHVPELETLRAEAEVALTADLAEQLVAKAPFMVGLAYLNADWVADRFRQLNDVFVEQISHYPESVTDYFQEKNGELHPMGRVFFHLVENKNDESPFAFLATYTEKADNGKQKHIPLKNALEFYKTDQAALLKLLVTVNQTKKSSQFINELVQSGEIFHPLKFTADEAFTFLQETPLYESCGVICRVPDWWKHKSHGVKVSVSLGEKTPSRVGFDGLLDFQVRLSLGDDALSLGELQAIVEEAQGLRLIKGKWVAVDQSKLQEALAAYQQIKQTLDKGELTFGEAMRLQLSGLDAMVSTIAPDCEVEVTQGEWLESLVAKIAQPHELPEVDCGIDFQAALRGYQQDGVKWLDQMQSMGFGACLADDMGLGKTIQVIALLNSLRQSGERKTLLVLPTSLIANWVNEINRFAPRLRYQVLHPSAAQTEAQEALDLMQSDLIITTYGMVGRYEWLGEINWDLLIIDEAQAIKNPGTKQTKNIKKLKAHGRIALTGTPIENRLSDLWSLFDFLNRGLLGSTTEFSRLSKGLKDRPEGYGRLKRVISPFMLRRLKTDKKIIQDLPDKIEMKTYATLSKKQTVLYQQLVKELSIAIKDTDGISRQGLVLASLMKFKQICNHPDQYLAQTVFLESESGKFARLREICEEIAQKRERVLIFTQFRQMVQPLAEFLNQVFTHQGLILHGGTSIAKRQLIVEQFQGENYVPFLVLSIKAGGIGLNLTAANHVIHFDRWWNPAVENQATDRAFRIGQHKNVVVHKFIMAGTIEEKIDLMIEDKIKLSGEIMPDIGENLITQLDNQALLDLIRLGE